MSTEATEVKGPATDLNGVVEFLEAEIGKIDKLEAPSDSRKSRRRVLKEVLFLVYPEAKPKTKKQEKEEARELAKQKAADEAAAAKEAGDTVVEPIEDGAPEGDTGSA